MLQAPESSKPQNETFARRPPRREPILLSRYETAEALGLGQRTVDELIAQGTLPSIRIGRRRLVRQDVLDKFVDVPRIATRGRGRKHSTRGAA